MWAMPSAYKSDQDTIIADWAVEAHAGKDNPAETLLCPAQWAGRLTWPATLHAIQQCEGEAAPAGARGAATAAGPWRASDGAEG